MLDPSSNEAIHAAASVDTGFDAMRVTATLSSARAPATVETGFGDLGGTPGPLQQGAPTVNAPNGSLTDWNAVSAFMNAVVPWPGAADPGYVNLHYSTVNPKPTPGRELIKGSGWPFRALDAFVQRAAWIEQTTNFKDVWFCTSRQSQMGTNTNGKPKAKRFAANALALKAIWIDLDVGAGDPKKYDTIQDAARAVFEFQKKAALPPASAMVASGSGLHVYWISDVPLERATWAQYAEGLRAKIAQTGLKCDAGLTTDAARLLRVPGTFNHKTTPPRPVQLLNIPLRAYNFETQLTFLKSIASPKINSSTPRSMFLDKTKLSGKPAAAFAALNPKDDALQAGIGRDDKLLESEPIFERCGFLGEARRTGGKDYGNPLWNLSVLCSTFMEDGNALAHEISKGYPSYSADDTQALYDRKMVERHDQGLGYPSCATIAANGCKSCASCPLFAKGKSPLNIRRLKCKISGPKSPRRKPKSHLQTPMPILSAPSFLWTSCLRHSPIL